MFEPQLFPYTFKNHFQWTNIENTEWLIQFGASYRPFADLKLEALKAARLICQENPSKTIAPLISGGLDSEVMLRSMVEETSSLRPFIVNFKYNEHDIEHARKLCKELNVEYEEFQLNLEDEDVFYELAKIADFYKIGYFAYLIPIYMMRKLNELDYLPVLGMGDPEIILNHEHPSFCYYKRYLIPYHVADTEGLDVIPEFWNYTPQLLASFIFEILRSAKENIKSTPRIFDLYQYKTEVYKLHWEIEARTKYNGYEYLIGNYRNPDDKFSVKIREFSDTIKKNHTLYDGYRYWNAKGLVRSISPPYAKINWSSLL